MNSKKTKIHSDVFYQALAHILLEPDPAEQRITEAIPAVLKAVSMAVLDWEKTHDVDDNKHACLKITENSRTQAA